MADLLDPFVGERAPRLAKRLIERFGGLSRALSADAPQQNESEIAEACRILQAARRLTIKAVREQLEGSPVRVNDPLLHEYLRSVLCADEHERFHAIYVDRHGGYLRDETVALGNDRQIRFRARMLLRRALELGADQLLLAHNHPSGDCRPSVDDVRTTDLLKTIAGYLDVVLIDHLIVTRSCVFSMRFGRKI